MVASGFEAGRFFQDFLVQIKTNFRLEVFSKSGAGVAERVLVDNDFVAPILVRACKD